MTVPRLRQLVIAAERLETADRLRELLGLGAPFADEGVGIVLIFYCQRTPTVPLGKNIL